MKTSVWTIGAGMALFSAGFSITTYIMVFAIHAHVVDILVGGGALFETVIGAAMLTWAARGTRAVKTELGQYKEAVSAHLEFVKELGNRLHSTNGQVDPAELRS